MSEQQLSVQQRLTRAYRNSGMTPEEFYQYVTDAYSHRIVCKHDDDLRFKIQVPEYQFDLEWFYYDASADAWLEG